MTAESNLLIACCRQFLGTDRAEDLSAAAQRVNWDVAVGLAVEHAVVPIVYSALKRDGRITIPAALIEQFQGNARRNLALTAELLKILDQLAAEGVTAIPLKGPLLAYQAYGDLSFRTFRDLDLLVSQDDVPAAWRVLANNGYSTEWAPRSSSKSAYLKDKERESHFVHRDGVLEVDLHWAFLPEYWRGASSLQSALTRVHSETFAGRPVVTLSAEDMLLFLCAHGGKHLWMRLGWVCDVAGVIRSRPNLDWSRFFALAAESVGMRIVSVGLLLASELLRVPLAEEAVRSLRPDPVAQGLAREIQERMFSENPLFTGGAELSPFYLRMIEGVARKIHFLSGYVIAPGQSEFRVITLPPWLYPFYYPLRIGRLVAKHTLSKLFRPKFGR